MSAESVLVITAASRGIGKAIAKLFLHNGWRVINCSRSACDLDGVDNIAVDLNAEQQRQELCVTLQDKVKGAAKISLVHNAAFSTVSKLAEQDLDELRRLLELCVIAPTELTQALLPQMQPGSSVIYIGSTLATKAVPGCYAYIAAKHAMVGMMRAACQDLAGTGVHAVMVAPGMTDTEMLRHHLRNSPEALEQAKAMVGDKRLIEPIEIADVVYCAAKSPVLNGSVIHANLGQIQR